MKKAVFCVLLGCFVIFGAQHAFAGKKCYQLSPFIDVMKVTITTQDSTYAASKLITGVWYVSGLYYMPAVGTYTKDADNVHKRLSIHVTNNDASYFSGYMDCVLDATLDKTMTPIQGPFVMQCGGAFNNSGTLIEIPCSDLPAPSAVESLSGEALGR